MSPWLTIFASGGQNICKRSICICSGLAVLVAGIMPGSGCCTSCAVHQLHLLVLPCCPSAEWCDLLNFGGDCLTAVRATSWADCRVVLASAECGVKQQLAHCCELPTRLRALGHVPVVSSGLG